ncbi:TetR/AcrR family transcriptional regulator [Curvibacter sp. CHRR-16]|uniref:TetR/AcrR family transcriptional regulator n=1 Tax=Curvibacter sp. CHRR-16 TaxID=2835872 RepID=UPI001BD9A461|nr:TetR/AcrR family transcriptional regulator [Curvibacter sp. CHRR-16]MBT0570658.1 TetR/AcrR family transcriptional regulator [Curvibacter sp. CHRR-16]
MASPKAVPQQARARQTYERILSATAEVLVQVGPERLTTNLVCEQAGLTPPALYRYFANKYALLEALGERLTQAQRDVLVEWSSVSNLSQNPQDLLKSFEGLFHKTMQVTLRFSAGVPIMRAMRSMPELQSVVMQSHQQIAAVIAALFVQAYPQTTLQTAQFLARTAMQIGYSMMEMLFDEPQLSTEQAAAAVARMVFALAEPEIRANAVGLQSLNALSN